MHESDMGGMIIVNGRNGLNGMIRLMMLWKVIHHCQARARFEFNFYKNYAQLILCWQVHPPAILTSQEGVIKGYTPLKVFYGINLISLVKGIQTADLELLYPFYMYYE